MHAGTHTRTQHLGSRKKIRDCLSYPINTEGFPGVGKESATFQMVKNLPSVQETSVRSLGGEDPLEKGTLPPPRLLPRDSHGQRRWPELGCPGGPSWSSPRLPLQLHPSSRPSHTLFLQSNKLHVVSHTSDVIWNLVSWDTFQTTFFWHWPGLVLQFWAWLLYPTGKHLLFLQSWWSLFIKYNFILLL